MANISPRDPFAAVFSGPEGFPTDAFDMIPALFRPVPRNATSGGPRIDVLESANAYRLAVDLPGIAKENIKVTVYENTVTIEAEPRIENEAGKDWGWLLRERSLGKFSRSLQLPESVDDAQSDARFENGVLHLTLPKTRAKATRQLKIS